MSVNQQRINELLSSDMASGAEVYSSDGKRLGSVVELQPAHFKVDAPLQRDYWLSMAYVVSATADEVRLSFPASDAAVYKLSEPRADEDVEGAPVDGEVILSEEEQREQRQRMARELAEQRQQLPHEHERGDAQGPPSTPGGTVGEPVERELRRMERLGEDALDAHLAGRGGAGIADEIERDVFDEAAAKIESGTLPMAPFPSVEAPEPRGVRIVDDDSRAGGGPGAERAVAVGHGVFWMISGMWPLLSIVSFQGITGAKHDLWLVKTVGSLIVVIGAVLTLAGLRNRVSPETRVLAIGAPAALTAIDLWYARKGRISRVYLLDALAEMALIAAWCVAGLRRRPRRS